MNNFFFATLLSLPAFLFPSTLSAAVVLNEIMYDLSGRDDGREWIELFNNGGESINLENWNIETTANHRTFTLLSGSFTLEPGDFAIIVQDFEEFLKDWPGFSGNVFQSTFSLRNDSASIFLKEGDKIIDSVDYDFAWGARGDGNSLQKIISGSSGLESKWVAASPTPGYLNQANPFSSPEAILENSDENSSVSEGGSSLINSSEISNEEGGGIVDEESGGVQINEKLSYNSLSAGSANMLEGSSVAPKNSPVKWYVALFLLILVSAVAVIFSPKKEEVDDIKIIEE